MNCLCVFTLILVSVLCDYVSINQQLRRNVLESEKVWQDIGERKERTSGEPYFSNSITNNGIVNVPLDNHLNRRINQKGEIQKSYCLENNLNNNNRVSHRSLGLYKFHRQPGLSKLLKDYFNHIRPTVLEREPSLGYHNIKYSNSPNGLTLGDSSKCSNSDSIKRVKDGSHGPKENWKYILDALVSQTKPVRLRDGISRPHTMLYKEPYFHTGHLTNPVMSDLLNIHNISKIPSYYQAPSVNRVNFNKNLSSSISFKNADNLIKHADYSNNEKLNSGIGGKTILQLSSLLENSLKDKIAHLNAAKSSFASTNSPLNSINLALIAKALSRNSDRGLNLKTNIPKGNREKNYPEIPNLGMVKLLNTPDIKDNMKSMPSFEKENTNSKISIITSNGASIDSVSSPLQTDYKTKTNCLDPLSAHMSEISNFSLFLSPVNMSQIAPITQLKELADQGNDIEINRLKSMTENLRRFLGEKNIILKTSGDPIKENNFIENLSSQGYTRLPSDVSSAINKKLSNHSSDLTGRMNVCYGSHPNDKQVQDSFVVFKSNALKASSTGLRDSTSEQSLFRNGSVHSTQFLNNLIPLLKSSSNLAIRKYSLDSDNIGIQNRVMNMGKSTIRLRTDSDSTCPSILDEIESIKHIPLSNTANRSKTYDIELISTTEGKIYIVMSERSRQSTPHQMASLNKGKITNSSRALEFALKVESTTHKFKSLSSTSCIKDSKAQFLLGTTKGCVMYDKSKTDYSPNSNLESGYVTPETIHNKCNFTNDNSLESYAFTTELDSSINLNHESSKTSPETGTANLNSLLHSNSNENIQIQKNNIMSLISNYTESNEVTTSKEDITFEPVSSEEYFTTNDFWDTIVTDNLDKVRILNKVKKQNTSNLASPMNNNRTEVCDSSNFIAKLANGANFETNTIFKQISSQSQYQETPSDRNDSVSSNFSRLESISGKNSIRSPLNKVSNLNELNNGIKYLSGNAATLHNSDYLNLINMLIARLQDNDKHEKQTNYGSSFLTSFGSGFTPNIVANLTVKAKGSNNNNNNTSNCSQTMFLTSNQTVNPGYQLLEAMRSYVVDNASIANSSFYDPAFESLLSDPQLFLNSAILNTINQLDKFPLKLQGMPFKNEPKDRVEKVKDNFLHMDPSLTKNVSSVGTKELDIVPKNVLDMINDANVKGIAVVLISLKPTEATTLLNKTDLKNSETGRGLPGTALLGANATIVIDVSNSPNHDDDANKTATCSNFKENNEPVGLKVRKVTLYPVFPLYPVYPVKPILSNFTHDSYHDVRS